MTRTKGSVNIPWERMVAELRSHPGRWILFPEMSSVSDRTIDVIRKRRRRALRINDGIIRCRRKTTVWTDEGTVRCTLFLSFDPKEVTPHGEEQDRTQGPAPHPE